MHKCRTINIFLTLGLKNNTIQYFRNIVEMNPATARCRVAACKVLTKVHLQECFTANNSKTKPDIDVISSPQCVSGSKDAEKCKKSTSEIFAFTGLLRPTDEFMLNVDSHFIRKHSLFLLSKIIISM